MKVEIMELSKLVLPEKNIRIHSERQTQEFVRSVKMFGQIRPIVIDEKNVILCGNGLYAALNSMGQTTAEVYRVTGLTENQKKKLMIADNKIFNLGIDDIKVLDDFINDLKDDLDVPGFDEETLAAMVADAEEAVSIINDYGVLSESESMNVDNGATAKEERINNIVAGNSNILASDNTENNGMNSENTHIVYDVTPERAVTQQDNPSSQFVVCPECGHKIWL